MRTEFSLKLNRTDIYHQKSTFPIFQRKANALPGFGRFEHELPQIQCNLIITLVLKAQHKGKAAAVYACVRWP